MATDRKNGQLVVGTAKVQEAQPIDQHDRKNCRYQCAEEPQDTLTGPKLHQIFLRSGRGG